MKKTYFDPQSKRNILPLTREQSEVFESNNSRVDATLVQMLNNDLRNELEDEFVRYCNERVQEFEIDSIDDFLSKSTDELTLLFNDTNDNMTDDDEINSIFDPEIEALASNDDGTGKATKKHFAELFQLISDAAIGRYNERFYYFYAYLTHWVDPKKAPYLDYDFLFSIDASRLKEIANDTMLQSKLRYILETYLESTQSSNNYVCRLDLTNSDLQMRLLRSLQKSITTNTNDFTVLEEARTVLVKDKLVYYYAGFKAYLFRLNLIKTHPSRLLRLQEQLNTYKQQQQQQQRQMKKSAKTTTQSSASTTNKKAGTSMSKQHKSAPATPLDYTSVTKTQHLLNERMKTFDKIQPSQVNEIIFPNQHPIKSAATQKSRGHAKQEVQLERLNSENEKVRGPVYGQYSLISGLKVKYSDGKAGTDVIATGTTLLPLQQPRDSLAYSFGSAND